MAKKNEKAPCQDFELGYHYTRTTGPVVAQFLSGLRNKKLLGVRSSNDQVIIPPMELDPKSGEPLTEFVNVAEEGEVLSWCWVRHPCEKRTIRTPFAWALIKLDGADTPILHCVYTDSESNMQTGMRVRVRWAHDTKGHITDIACFDPVMSQDN